MSSTILKLAHLSKAYREESEIPYPIGGNTNRRRSQGERTLPRQPLTLRAFPSKKSWCKPPTAVSAVRPHTQLSQQRNQKILQRKIVVHLDPTYSPARVIGCG